MKEFVSNWLIIQLLKCLYLKKTTKNLKKQHNVLKYKIIFRNLIKHNLIEFSLILKFLFLYYVNFKIQKNITYRSFYKLFKLNSMINFFYFNNTSTADSAKFDFLYLQSLYLDRYLSFVFQLPIKQLNLNSLYITPIKFVNEINATLTATSWRMYGLKYLNDFINTLVTSVSLRNVNLICQFMKDTLNSTFFKEHRRFFKFFFYLFSDIIWPYRDFLKIEGVYLQFRGKLARGGDARKSVLTLKKGLHAFGSKKLCMNYNKWAVWTKTGSVGCVLHIYY